MKVLESTLWRETYADRLKQQLIYLEYLHGAHMVWSAEIDIPELAAQHAEIAESMQKTLEKYDYLLETIREQKAGGETRNE